MKTWNAGRTCSDQGLIIEEETGRTIAVAYNNENTALLAAAPELLAALEALHKYTMEHAPEYHRDDLSHEVFFAMIKATEK